MVTYASKVIVTAAKGMNRMVRRPSPIKFVISGSTWSSQPPFWLRELDSSRRRCMLRWYPVLLARRHGAGTRIDRQLRGKPGQLLEERGGLQHARFVAWASGELQSDRSAM